VKRNRTIEMLPSRRFRESAASARGEMRVVVIAVEPIYANVRLRLTANRTYGLDTQRVLPAPFEVLVNLRFLY
jgi:hypothetical protein